MKCYIVTFETESETSLQQVNKLLKTSYKFYCPIHEYCWAIKTDETAVQVRDKLMKLSTGAERVFVIRSGIEAAWLNSYGDKNNKWLQTNL